MKTKIIKLLKEIEEEKKVKILFSVESGSRAWGMGSENSDYDVRFVYVRPLEDYISINNPAETISRNYNKKGERVGAEGCFIDCQGFDIFKFTRMLWVSNPTSIEWLLSEVFYYGNPEFEGRPSKFVEFALFNFKPISLYYHYKSMCKQNYLKYLKSGNLITYKKYLYAMRGLINAKWIAKYRTLPPIDFPKTLEELKGKGIVPDEIIKELENIVKLKKDCKEKDIVKNYSRIDDYIESFLKDDSEAPKEKQLSTINELDEELRKIILK